MTSPTRPEDVKTRQAAELVEEDGLEVSPPDSSVVALAIKGEIDAQIATARAWPRDIKAFLNELETMACSSQAVAASCFYKLKRRDKDGSTKFIEGPSVRFAELAASAYTNMRVQGRTTHDDGNYVYTVGTALDLQKNVGFQVENRRRITNRNGQRFNDDMVAVTANASISISVRNATFRVIPRALWDGIFQKAKATAVGDQKSFLERRAAMIEYFTQKVGVTIEQVCEYLEIPNIEAMTFDDLENAIGLATGLKDGDIKFEEAFPTKKDPANTTPPAAAQATPLQNLTQRLQQEQTPQAPETPGPAEPQPATPPAVQEPEPPAMSREESNALDLELANEETTTDAQRASAIQQGVKEMAAGKGMPGPKKSSRS